MTSVGRVRCARCQATIEKGDLRCAVCAQTVPFTPAASDDVEKLKVFRCQGCGAATSWSTEKNALACAFCGAATALEEIADPMEQTERWLPFAVDDGTARAALSVWQRSLGFFRPSDLAAQSTVDNLRPLWWPAWIFDATARATWSADSDHGSNRSDWAPHAGDAELSFERILVGASRGLSHKEMDALADAYDLAPATRDRPAEQTGLVEEQFDVQRSAAREKVAAACHALAQERIEAQHIPGKRFRKVKLSLVLSDLVTQRVALPAWVLAYRYHGRLFRVVVHGQDGGRVIGDAPWSKGKIALAILGGAVVVAGIVLAIVLASHGGHAPAARHR
ncbi:MAG TPA: zinc ribbon domain-containing protein [Myxococcota bacterium]